MRCIIFLFILFYLPLAYSVKVWKLSIQGNQFADSALIRSHIQLKKGSVYKPNKAQRDVKKLFSLGFFDDINVYTSYDKKGRLKLLYKFKERLFISQIQFKGNENFNTKELDELSLIKEYSFLDYDKLEKTILDIKEKYKEKAYYLAEVSYSVKKDAKKQSHTLTIEIQENSKLLIKRINFIGNRNISAQTLKSFMLTKEKSLLSFLGFSGVYQGKNIERDLQAIQYYYRDKGYLNAQVYPPEINITPDKKFLYINFTVSEGVRFKMGKEIFKGDDVVSEEEAQKRFKLAEKDYFSLGALQEDIQMISLLYKNKGYAFVKVHPLFSLDQTEENKMHVSFQVKKGKVYTVRRISITGNNNARDKVVLRRFQIKEGEPFNQSKVELTRQLLQQLAYFEKVDIQPVPHPAGQAVLDLKTRIKERENTGEAHLAGGYNSQTRLFIQAGLKKQNFLGLDQSVSLNIVFSKYQENFIFSYQNPYFLDSNWNFNFDIFNTGQQSFTGSAGSNPLSAIFESHDYLNYFRLDTGFSFSIGRHVSHFSTLFLKYKLNDIKLSEDAVYYLRNLPVLSSVFNFLFSSKEKENTTQTETAENSESSKETEQKATPKNTTADESLKTPAVLRRVSSDIYNLEEGSGLNSSLSAIWEYDKRNDRYYPSAGFFTRLSAEYSGLGGDFNWIKAQGDFRHYYSPFWKLVIKNRLDLGWVFSNDKNQQAPFTELFLLGGPYDLRGFGVRTQGPKRFSQKTYDSALEWNKGNEEKVSPREFAMIPYGGEQKFFYSLELEVPIVEKAGLRAAVFFDLGEANNTLSFNLKEQLRADVGFGIRWRSPFGPLSLDWALPYKPRKEYQEQDWEFHFSFGSSL